MCLINRLQHSLLIKKHLNLITPYKEQVRNKERTSAFLKREKKHDMDLELNISFTHTHALCIVEYNVSARLVISLSALPVGLLVSYLCALHYSLL